jgi:peptide/nickel transport system substrate-binding protein
MAEGGRSGAGGAALRTFLIADVRGYTYFTQTHGDEAAARLAATFADVAHEVVTAAGGRVQELRGDEALCVFTSPRQAVRAAVELQRRFVALTLEDPETPYGVGIGLDTGEAVRVKGGYRGGALNLAARLCSIAKAGEVLASREATHLAGRLDEVSYVERGRVSLKGIEQPTTVVAVVPASNPAADPAFLTATRPRQAAVIARQRRRRRQFVALSAALAVLLVSDVAVAVDRAGRLTALSSIGTNAIGLVDTGQGVLYDRVHLPLAGPGPMATDGQTVWVTDTVDNTLLAVDTAHSQVANTISVGQGPAGVAIGEGAVWVTSSGFRSVARVDRRSDKVVDTIGVGNGPTAVATGAGSVWVTNRLDGTVSVINPQTDAITATVPVGGQPASIVVVGDAVWVANQSSATVARIDARTDQVVATIPVGDLPSALAYADGAVWVANTLDGTVSRIDASTNTVTATVTTGGEPTSLAADSGDVWVADATGDQLVHIEGTRVSGEVPLGNAPTSIVLAAGRLWVSASGSAVSHFGGTLRVVDSGEDILTDIGTGPSLDPAIGYRLMGWSLEKDMYDGLVTLHHVGGPGGDVIVPDLARTLPSVSDDGRTYTFQLRSGLQFSDGTPVRASDFRRSYVRMLQLPGYAHGYYTSVLGAAACADHHQCAGIDKGIVVDDTTGSITMYLSQPDGELLYQLALPFASVVGPKTPTRDMHEAPIVGTGPYELDPATKGNHLVLRRNPNFHVWSAAARPPGYPDVIDISLLGDQLTGTVLTETTKGRYDVAPDVTSGHSLARLQANAPTDLHPYPSLATRYYFLNTRVGAFRNVLARRAVNFALNRARASQAFGGHFFQSPTCQVLPPSMYGYRPYCPYTVHPDASGIWSGPDLAKARQLVARSGTAGDTVQVWVRPDHPDYVQELVRTLRELGYRVTLRRFTRGSDQQRVDAYFTAASDPKRPPQAAADGWIADYPAPSNFIQILLTCGQFSAQDFSNDAEFCDPAIDAKVNHALALQLTDPAAAGQQWAEIDHELTDQAAWVPIANGVGWDVVSPRTGNYERHPSYGPLLDQMWVR